MAAAEAARLVLTAILATSAGSEKPKVEPGLNPNQPSQRMNTPKATSPGLCPGIKVGEPSSWNFPKRGPSW